MNQKQDSDSSSSQQQFQQQNSLPTTRDEPEVTAQKILLEQFEKQQRDAGKVLSQDVEFKLDQVLEDIREEDTGDFQTIISLRMKELAYSKILVLTYEKSFFRLVQAHFHIGREYLRFKCYDQALFHLESAISKNIKAGTSPVNKFYHSFLLSYHGEVLLALKKFKEAEGQLQKAINLQEEYQENSKQIVNNVRSLIMFALVKSQQNINEGKRLIQNAVKKAKIVVGQNSKVYSLALCDQARILHRTSDKAQICSIYKQAIKCLQMSNEAQWQEQVMKIYDQLASLSKELSQNEEWIKALKQKYQIVEQTYGNADKRAIKEQRTLASALLSLKKIDQSLDQFDDILEKQQKVYGENSIQVGKQYKTIGNIHTLRNDTKNADKNFKKALKIFHDLGQQRLAKQVKLKISSTTYM